MKVQDIGEQGLLQRLQAFCPADLVGDDAAILATQPGRSLIVTADMLVDGVHFSEQTTAPEDAGWRAAAANLSDLAAMGATPLGLTVCLGLPGSLAVDWVESLYRGLVECLQQYGTVIVGGDVCRSPTATVAITAFGEADPDCIIRRSTAQPGDAIVVTGPHGLSRAGLELLLHPELGESLTAADRALLIRSHHRPQPRLDVLPFLNTLRQEQFTAETGILHPVHIAGMDSSDGLADAIVQICRASGVGARVDRSQIPIPAALADLAEPTQLWQWILYGGEDFELVLCCPLPAAAALVRQVEGATIVGRITAEPQVWLIDLAQEYPTEPLTLEKGFQHFD